MLSIHWQSRPQLAHTVTLSMRGSVVWASVITYEGENESRAVEGFLDSVFPMLVKENGRYRLTVRDLALARYHPDNEKLLDNLRDRFPTQGMRGGLLLAGASS